ncbi:MAG: Gfo/Idh/MocA family oxidoreductase [Chloroflexi bacterium]|nr:Gfo/Idh/MocA family oxidoreductase [Chloroflexota bacterium]
MISIAVIGFGYWGPNLVRNFMEVSHARIGAICDSRPERLAAARQRYPSAATFSDCAPILADSSVTAVVIATPVASHFRLVMEALGAGKHVFIEKPLAASAAEAERMVAEAARCRRVLMVDHTFVYTSAVRKIKEIIDSGGLGRLYYYDSVRVNLGLFQSDANVIWDLAAHDCSIIDHLLPGLPRRIAASAVSHIAGQPESMAYVTLFFDDDLIAHLHVNWLSPVKVRQTLIGGSRRMIVYDDIEPSEKVKVYDSGVEVNGSPESVYQTRISYRTGDMYAPKISHDEALKAAAQHFVDCVESGARPLTDAEAGLRVVKMLEAATESAKRGGASVELNW